MEISSIIDRSVKGAAGDLQPEGPPHERHLTTLNTRTPMGSKTVDHAARIASVTQTADAAGIDRPIAKSWSRCIESYGLSPTDRHTTLVLDSPEIEDHRAPLDYLVAIAGGEMQNLYAATAGSGYAIMLTNASGIIMRHICDPNLEKEFRKAGLWVGADWGEQQEGTNGIGTCIVERQSITVHREEHFRQRNIGLTCSAAPIFDPEGGLLAVLDSSSCSNNDSRSGQAHVRALVQMSAALISNCNFLRHFRDDCVLRFHSRPEYVGLLNEGMLALNRSGTILAANHAAVLLLHQTSLEQLVGKSISEVMDVTPELIRGRLASPVNSLWSVREIVKGRRFFAMLYGRKPASPKPPSEGATARFTLDLQAVAGGDPKMQENVRLAERVKDKNIAILLLGETGTGKEVFARAIHSSSDRAKKPFVAVNCSAIPESLIESELFGYRHGAFTGARREGLKGKILESTGGTLFLDEIGDMPLELQARLLRVIEDHHLTPLGSDKSVPIVLNVISATHRNLELLVEQGKFREDLFYRLNGISLHLPPLRDRKDERDLILSIIACERDPDQAVDLGESAFAKLEAYHWPGNIRQLKNVLRTALAISGDGPLSMDDLRLPARETAIPQPAEDELAAPATPLDAAEKEAILLALAANCWNMTNTASQLKMSRNTLYRKLKKHGLPNAKPR